MTSEREPAERHGPSAAALAAEAHQRCADLSASSPFHFRARESTAVCMGCCVLALERDRRERGDPTAAADRAAWLERELLRLEKQALLLLDATPSALPAPSAPDDLAVRAINVIGSTLVATYGVVKRALSVTKEDCIPLVRALNGEGPEAVASGEPRLTAGEQRVRMLEELLRNLHEAALRTAAVSYPDRPAHEDPAVRAAHEIGAVLAALGEVNVQLRLEAAQTHGGEAPVEPAP